jgi:hypothetical protein
MDNFSNFSNKTHLFTLEKRIKKEPLPEPVKVTIVTIVIYLPIKSFFTKHNMNSNQL